MGATGGQERGAGRLRKGDDASAPKEWRRGKSFEISGVQSRIEPKKIRAGRAEEGKKPRGTER